MAREFSGPNLSPAVRAIERLMDDDCEITRDAAQDLDDVLNEATGLLTAPDYDATIRYQGRCTCTASRSARDEGETGALTAQRAYRLTAPVGVDAQKGDVVRITASRRDPSLIGSEFTVTDVLSGTFNVATRVEMLRR